jgi:methyltransferase of ATP-grasp peptide maturase system
VYATDLSDEEQAIARQRLAALSQSFSADGILVSLAWRHVFQRTGRHPYVPSYYPEIDRPSVLCVGDPAQRNTWLNAVYSDQTLVTKVVQVPMSRAFSPATSPMYVSSSTLPSLILRMLETLDVRDGHRVLEIGTGTGYNCALLCERLGSPFVTSVDVDPELVDLATERLAANGYKPTLVAVDGARGYPLNAPYDRIISTCAVPEIPNEWLNQAAPGAVILTDLRRKLGGTLIRLTVSNGIATGRFEPYAASFMWMRSTVEPAITAQVLYAENSTDATTTDVDPALLLNDDLFGFVAQWQLPDANRRIGTRNGHRVLHLETPDGSHAEVSTEQQADETYPVIQNGPRLLWDKIEEIYAFWINAGRPGYERFGLTITPTEQHVWLDTPDSDHRWELHRAPIA